MMFENGSQSLSGKWINHFGLGYHFCKAVNDYARFREFLAYYQRSQFVDVCLAALILNQSAGKN
jgi:hypothetical protein